MKKTILCILVLFVALSITVPGLSGGNLEERLPEGGDTENQVLTICTEPRPQICTMDYQPVCAQLQDGTFETYSNGCTACADPVVTGYREGACE